MNTHHNAQILQVWKIYLYIYHTFETHVGEKNTIHGASGMYSLIPYSGSARFCTIISHTQMSSGLLKHPTDGKY